MTVKFVLLSVGRSGTSHIIAMLRQTKGVFAQGEIFHEDVPTHISPDVVRAVDISLRDRDPRAFVDAVLGYAPGDATAVGFKMWWNHNPDACRYVLEDESVRKIIVERSNRLAWFASNEKALATTIWNMPADKGLDQKYRDARPPFSAQRFADFAAWADGIFQSYRRLSRGPVLECSYQDILDGLAYRKCTAFLDLEASVEEPQGYLKLNGSDIVARFAESDRDAIVADLARIGRPEWASERARTAGSAL